MTDNLHSDQSSKGWYEGPFDVHPGSYFPREIVRWECPRHGQTSAVDEAGCQLCLPSLRLKPRRIVFVSLEPAVPQADSLGRVLINRSAETTGQRVPGGTRAPEPVSLPETGELASDEEQADG